MGGTYCALWVPGTAPPFGGERTWEVTYPEHERWDTTWHDYFPPDDLSGNRSFRAQYDSYLTRWPDLFRGKFPDFFGSDVRAYVLSAQEGYPFGRELRRVVAAGGVLAAAEKAAQQEADEARAAARARFALLNPNVGGEGGTKIDLICLRTPAQRAAWTDRLLASTEARRRRAMAELYGTKAPAEPPAPPPEEPEPPSKSLGEQAAEVQWRDKEQALKKQIALERQAREEAVLLLRTRTQQLAELAGAKRTERDEMIEKLRDLIAKLNSLKDTSESREAELVRELQRLQLLQMEEAREARRKAQEAEAEAGRRAVSEVAGWRRTATDVVGRLQSRLDGTAQG
ncbi:hypothetical protein HYH03_009472 [Edaphochlamys debaryana]|uniref:Uncharacterized protein n=1 Tax=Edaphochlamys debaryana TaxID=47281 RepID=A0A835XW58_9CHLO|nr:hypothetical protein HYH03_009472 [Edaphochlamys debaryana]|eukprot:KAG2492227.1 hypothetical protein HYH03_009472 [Edaphochlamys debaryana]